jgi:hypothetical protein
MSGLIKRHIIHYLRIAAAVGLLLVVPFVSAPRASALQMRHTGADTRSDCAVICARANSSTPPQQFAIDKDEVQVPDPEPPETVPYYAQLQGLYVTKAVRPCPIFASSSFRPPDLVTLYANFRF